MKTRKRQETPAQTIKRLKKELCDEEAKNEIMSSLIDAFDKR